MGDVIDFRPKPKPDGWTNDLLSLPECPIKACSKCGHGIYDEPQTWIHAKYGCGVCAPQMDEVLMELSGHASRASLLESALVYLYREVHGHKGVERVLANHMLRVEGDRVVSVMSAQPQPESEG